MYVVTVKVSVLPEYREEFIAATLENARNTVHEPLNLRFDVLQEIDDQNRFTLVEAYRNESGMEAHKATAHYNTWRETVEKMMAEKRIGTKHMSLFPETEECWATVRE
ncbi:MAG: antibiotic biosynthesis monooxygenase [Planctomycetes bacterium]|nr:antibiotic biosynthesis monooxygenase [Planctomycetota bacterium]